MYRYHHTDDDEYSLQQSEYGLRLLWKRVRKHPEAELPVHLYIWNNWNYSDMRYREGEDVNDLLGIIPKLFASWFI